MSEARDSTEVLKKALVELKKLKAEREARAEPIAIIGAACRFPGGADSVEGLWRILSGGVDAIGPIPAERWDVEAHYAAGPSQPGKMYVKEGGFIAGVDQFDARFFGISPREALAMDPQQRLLLEVSWEALEHAGLPAERLAGTPTGVFIGLSSNDYLQLLARGGRVEDSGYVLTGVVPSIAAGRIAHTLGLQGPNLLIDTACSSSLIATHLATRALRAGECNLALVGGVNALLAPEPTEAFCQLHALAPDGRCKTFDASANGYVRSEGCGVVVLKRLSDALRDRDRIMAVIRGIASNHDGHSSGITVPNGAAQQAVLRSALADAGLAPRDIGYLEAHGTGTPLGDPIELRSAAAVYGVGRSEHDPLVIGSVKANLGHLEAAAGVAALLKAALVLERQEIPRQIHFRQPNPHLGLESVPVRVPTESLPFPTNGKLRRVAVSAFGFSGSNAHVILEEAPTAPERLVTPSRFLLPISAKSEAALRTAVERHLPFLEGLNPAALTRLVATAAQRRSHHEHRVVVVGADAASLQQDLSAWLAGEAPRRVLQGTARLGKNAPLVLIYSGQGTAWAGMARGLEADPVFRGALEEVEAALAQAGLPAVRAVFEDEAKLERTRWAQPAIFALQVALTAWWRARGVAPDAVLGHSVGEVAAAHVAGALSLQAAAELVVARAEGMDQATGQGRMLAVRTSAAVLRARFPEFELAADNGPESVVVAGSAERLAGFQARCRELGLEVVDLGVDYAFHTGQMAPAAAGLAARLQGLRPSPTTLPFYSSVQGAQLEGPALGADYWADNVRQTVRFREAVEGLIARGHTAFLEVGPHPALLPHVQAIGQGRTVGAASLRKGQDAETELSRSVAQLHVQGLPIDWGQVIPAQVPPVPLPSYPWEHRRYWAPAPAAKAELAEVPLGQLAGRPRSSPVFDGLVLEARLAAHAPSYLRDHAMQGVTLLPAAAFLELARSAATQAQGPGPVRLEGVVIRAPLIFEEGAVHSVQTSVHREGALQVHSGGANAWTLHLEARVASSAPPPTSLHLATAERLDPAERYRLGRSLGAGLGPAFQVLTQIDRGEGSAVASARLPEAAGPGEADGIHPALLDACFQAAVLAYGAPPEGGEVLLPSAVAAAYLDRAGPGPHTASFQVTGSGDGWFEGEGRLHDRDQRLVAALSGVRFQRLPSSAWAAARASAPQWLELALRPASDHAPLSSPRRWAVLGDDADLWAERLSAASPTTPPGEVTDLLLISPTLQDALQSLRSAPTPERLFWITRDAATDPEAAAVLGLARSAALELDAPALYAFNLAAGGEAALLEALLRPGAERELWLGADGAKAPRWVEATRPQGTFPSLRAESAYLVSGGLGALGLATAEWLCAQGAQRLALLGRQPPTPEAELRLAALRAQGARVQAMTVDVTDAKAVGRAISMIEAELGPVAGVVHGAGHLEDALLPQVDGAQMARSWAPKVEGARALAAALSGRDLQFFVAYSSLAASFGSPGQASYTAANAGLEAFVARLRAQGWPAYAVAFGPWSIGMAAAKGRGRPGLQALTPAVAGAALAELLAGPPRNVSIAQLDWPGLLQALGRRRPASLGGWVEALPKGPIGAAALRALLEGAAPTARPALAEAWISEAVRGILGLDPEELIDPVADFVALGMDSLMALELRDRVETGLGTQLPAAATFERRQVRPLAALVVELLGNAPSAGPVTIVPDLAARHAPFPLSDVQTAYWLGRTGAFELGGTSCHYYGELDRVGLDVERLGRAWRALVERHEMLRAVVRDDGQQQILPDPPPYTIDVRDLRGQAPAAVEAALTATRAELSHQVFDPDRWPLFDLRLHRLDGDRTRLHLSFDLLILDVSSFLTLLNEWRRLYEGETLEPLSLSFRDYQLWERAQEESESFAASLAHWRGRIESLPGPPELPLARRPKEMGRPHFERRATVLSAERWARFKGRCQAHGLTPAMAVGSAYAHVLERFSKSKHFTLNLTLFNRAPVHPEVNRVLGDFTSLILLEVDHQQRGSFLSRAQALQERLRLDLPHRQVSGVRVLREWSKLKGRMVGAPVIFTSGIGMTDSAQVESDRTDAWFGQSVYSVSQTPQVWLDHQVYERSGQLLLFWDAVEALFPAGLLDAMFEAYRSLLERLADQAEAWEAVEALPLPEAMLAPRRAANQTAAPLPEGLLHRALARQADQRPDAWAVIGSDQRLSYGALSAAALRVAARLRRLGVQPGDRVAVALPKSAAQIVAVLGILEADGVYLPISRGQPAERLAYLLENAGAQLVITDPERAAGPWPSGVRGLGLDPNFFPEEIPERRPSQRRPSDLAYLIYTSGSTGRPKGVMIDHRGALNTVVDVNQRFSVGPEDRIFGISDLGFDLSVYDVFGALEAGACLVLPEDQGLRDPAHWLALMQAHRVSLYNSVPALMKMLLEYLRGVPEAALPDSLRSVLLSGDWIPVDLPGELKRRAPAARIVSLGGATEASIWSILFPIEAVDPSWPSIPYGRPMLNQRFHVLDAHGQDAPTWVPGQLHIGGVGLAQGYHGDAEKTAAKFVTDPRTGERLYATGDLGRYLPDGNLEFLGREDFQLKIQGHRIELGEIEGVLLEHPQVQAAVVAPYEARPGDRQLVAYLLTSTPVEASALRAHLAQRLPAHMVPRIYQCLERFPLSGNGKVDRSALPKPVLSTVAHKAPQTELEQKIWDVWARILGRPQLGVDESFFDAGGDSQLAVRAMLELRDGLGRELPIRALFETPTVEGLAQALGGDASPSGPELGEADLYAHYGRRGIGQRLAALGTDKSFRRALGNRLWYDDQGRSVEVLDMVGGYGSAMLGHNHPEIVALAAELLQRGEPFHAQYTNNRAVGRLCKALSDRLESATGGPFVITLASTGTEAIEAALKHAKMEYRARAEGLSKASESVAAVILDQALKGKVRAAPELYDQAEALLGVRASSLSELFQQLSEANQRTFEREPVFYALEHAFHGMSTGALSLTASADFRAPFHWMGVKVERLPQRPEVLAAAVEAAQGLFLGLGFDAAGRAVLKTRPWHWVAGLFLEPIQGEGGIRPLDPAFLTAARASADQAGFPLIVDEIQCGMGRTGRFLASELVGLRGDYYTLSKSLGGGASKVSAMAVAERRYQAEFGYVHGSTFAEDGVSAHLALKTLELIDRDRLLEAAEQKGRLFRQKLEGLQARHPTVIQSVRGAGLMLGIQIATQEQSPSMVLRVVSQSDPEMFNQILAGYLLNEQHLRIAPTKTRSTIRFLPSAYVTEAEMDRVVEAFESVCLLIERVNIGRLLRHLVVPDADPKAPIADWRDRYPSFRDDPPNGERRVAHIAHVEDDASLLLAEPSLAEIPAEQRQQLLWRLFRFTRPAIGQRMRITTATGESVHVSLIGLIATGEIFESMIKSGERALLVDKIQEAVDLAVRSGCEVIGFGGYTSIVTLNCTAVATPRAALTSGNAYTVALAVEGALQTARERGLDLDQAQVAIVGGAGNIGSVAAKIMAEHVGKVVLVARDASDPRLGSIANQIFCNAEDALLAGQGEHGVAHAIRGHRVVEGLQAAGRPIGGGTLRRALEEELGGEQPYVTISNDLRVLKDCQLIISCTSSAGSVIRPEHLSERVQVICDVATPKDVDDSVRAAFPGIRVISGGLAQLPGQPGIKLSGTHLPVDHLYGCVAETALLGVDGRRAHFSFGDISMEQVEHIRTLAVRHGFRVGRVDRET